MSKSGSGLRPRVISIAADSSSALFFLHYEKSGILRILTAIHTRGTESANKTTFIEVRSSRHDRVLDKSQSTEIADAKSRK
jgi:hypothetical protein